MIIILVCARTRRIRLSNSTSSLAEVARLVTTRSIGNSSTRARASSWSRTWFIVQPSGVRICESSSLTSGSSPIKRVDFDAVELGVASLAALFASFIFRALHQMCSLYRRSGDCAREFITKSCKPHSRNREDPLNQERLVAESDDLLRKGLCIIRVLISVGIIALQTISYV